MKITVGTTGLAWSISEALPIRKTYKATIHSSQEAMTSTHSEGRGSSLNYMRTHLENIVLFDGETYSPEWCIELRGLGEDYQFYNEEH